MGCCMGRAPPKREVTLERKGASNVQVTLKRKEVPTESASESKETPTIAWLQKNGIENTEAAEKMVIEGYKK